MQTQHYGYIYRSFFVTRTCLLTGMFFLSTYALGARFDSQMPSPVFEDLATWEGEVILMNSTDLKDMEIDPANLRDVEFVMGAQQMVTGETESPSLEIEMVAIDQRGEPLETQIVTIDGERLEQLMTIMERANPSGQQSGIMDLERWGIETGSSLFSLLGGERGVFLSLPRLFTREASEKMGASVVILKSESQQQSEEETGVARREGEEEASPKDTNTVVKIFGGTENTPTTLSGYQTTTISRPHNEPIVALKEADEPKLAPYFLNGRNGENVRVRLEKKEAADVNDGWQEWYHRHLDPLDPAIQHQLSIQVVDQVLRGEQEVWVTVIDHETDQTSQETKGQEINPGEITGEIKWGGVIGNEQTRETLRVGFFTKDQQQTLKE